MTYNHFRYIFFGGAGLAGLCLAIAVILFFVFDIPRVIGDLTGISARKAIEDIRNQNENSGKKTYKSSTVNRERGKVTAKITPSGNLVKNPTGDINAAMATVKIRTEQQMQPSQSPQDNMPDSMIPTDTTVLTSQETTVLDSTGSEETTVLSSVGSEETTVLSSDETTVLSSDETTVLSSDETTVLSTEETTVLNQNAGGMAVGNTEGFVIEYELTLIHTNEMIA